MPKLTSLHKQLRGDTKKYIQRKNVRQNTLEENKLIVDATHPASGWFGPKTRAAIKSEYQAYKQNQIKIQELEAKKQALQDEAQDEAEEVMVSI